MTVLVLYISIDLLYRKRKGANKEGQYEQPLPRIETDRAEHEYGEISEPQTRNPRTQAAGCITLMFTSIVGDIDKY